MRKGLSVLLSGSLVLASVLPALSADVVRGETAAPKVLPVVTVNTQLAPAAVPGVQNLATLPSVNSVDAQAIDAAAMLAPAPSAVVPGAELSAPVNPLFQPTPEGTAPHLNAAVEASAEAAQNETAGAQLDRVEDGVLTGDKSSADRAWSGLRDAVSSEGVPVMSTGQTSRFSLSRTTRVLGTAGVAAAVALDSNIALAGTGAAPAAPAALPHWLSGLVAHYSGWLTVGAAAGIIYAVNRGVQMVIDRAAKAAGWEKSTIVVVKRAATLGVFGLGTVVSLHLGGAPVAVITAVAGLGTTAVTMASKTILGNALEASKVLLYHSFIVGDKVKIGDDTFTVKDLSLRYVTLQNDAYKSSPTNFTYLQLASMPITILHAYEATHKLKLDKSIGVGTVAGAAGQTISSASRKTWLWLLGSLAVAIGATYAAPLIAMPALFTVLTYLKGAAIFAAAHNIRSFVLDFITKLSQKAGWHPQTTLVAKLVAEVLSYTIGGSWALRALGTTWMTVLGGLGTTGIAFTLVTQDILSNLVTAGWLMSDRNKEKSIKIGEYVATGKILGKVVDMNFQYVVLDHENGTHTLISYAYLKDNPFSIISQDDLPAAQKKYAPPTAAPAAPPETK